MARQRKKKPNPLNPGPGLAYAPTLDEPDFPYYRHAPEPWRDTGDEVCSDAGGLSGNIVCDKPKFGESAKYWPANAERIVNCVNALEGVHNPQVLPQVLKTLRYINGRCFTVSSDDGVLSIELGSQANVDKFVIGLAQLVRELDGQETGAGDE
jgi:hypothetical protein